MGRNTKNVYNFSVKKRFLDQIKTVFLYICHAIKWYDKRKSKKTTWHNLQIMFKKTIVLFFLWKIPGSLQSLENQETLSRHCYKNCRPMLNKCYFLWSPQVPGALEHDSDFLNYFWIALYLFLKNTLGTRC